MALFNILSHCPRTVIVCPGLIEPELLATWQKLFQMGNNADPLTMKDRQFKDTMYNGLSKMLKALANPYRLEIIDDFTEYCKRQALLFLCKVILKKELSGKMNSKPNFL